MKQDPCKNIALFKDSLAHFIFSPTTLHEIINTYPTQSQMKFTLFLLTAASLFSIAVCVCDWTVCLGQVCPPNVAPSQGDCLCGWTNSSTQAQVNACIVGECPNLEAADAQEGLSEKCCSKFFLINIWD